MNEPCRSADTNRSIATYVNGVFSLVTATTSVSGGFAMDRVSVDLQHCYGIKSLKHDFDFSKTRAFAVYAPNGAMKSSFALTFKDLATGAQPKDRIFPERATSAKVTDENGAAIENDRVLVVLSYDEELGPSENVHPSG